MSLKDKVMGIFKRGHPDVYKAVSEYAEKQGISIADAIAAATSAYMASDAEGKKLLEEAMEERRTTKPAKGGTDLKDSIGQVTELLNALGGVFGALNEVRSTLSIRSVVEDFKSIRDAAKEIQTEGTKAGAGSIDDVLANAFVQALAGRAIGGVVKKGTKTGETAGKEKAVTEEP